MRWGRRFALVAAVTVAASAWGCNGGSGGGDDDDDTGTEVPETGIVVLFSDTTFSLAPGSAADVDFELTRVGDAAGESFTVTMPAPPAGVTVAAEELSPSDDSGTLQLVVAIDAPFATSEGYGVRFESVDIGVFTEQIIVGVLLPPNETGITAVFVDDTISIAQGGAASLDVVITRTPPVENEPVEMLLGAGTPNGVTQLPAAILTGTSGSVSLDASATATIGTETVLLDFQVAGRTMSVPFTLDVTP